MSKINRDTREFIAKKAVETSFAEEEKAFQQEEHHLAMACYQALFNKDILKLVHKLPKEWFRWEKCLRFNCDGWDIKLTALEDVPVPYSHTCSRLGSITGELAQTVQKFSQDKKAFQEKRVEAYRKTLNLLESVGSMKRLKTVWPEGKAFYQEFDVEIEKNLPAIPVTRVNEILGLTVMA